MLFSLSVSEARGERGRVVLIFVCIWDSRVEKAGRERGVWDIRVLMIVENAARGMLFGLEDPRACLARLGLGVFFRGFSCQSRTRNSVTHVGFCYCLIPVTATDTATFMLTILRHRTGMGREDAGLVTGLLEVVIWNFSAEEYRCRDLGSGESVSPSSLPRHPPTPQDLHHVACMVVFMNCSQVMRLGRGVVQLRLPQVI
ncbi:hypothetical protein F4802DRAFT_217066 [Xylaria palmicola]|nr:hypothetical protein F4802DRAFT_217066 [Xylaria palmicola]